MSDRPGTTPTPSPTVSPGDVNSRLDPLFRDRDQLLRQIDQLNPTQIDEQINLRNQQLVQLRDQLGQIQTSAQSLNQQLNQSLQFRSVVQQGMLTELDDRVRIQERLIQSTRDQIAAVTLNPAMYDPGFLPGLQAQLNVQEQQLQALLAQRSTISANTMEEINRLNQQTLTNRAVLASARTAVESQIRFLEQDQNRLVQEKANLEALRQQYQREADQVEQQLRNLGADELPRKELKFP